jgi:hypothetical protein
MNSNKAVRALLVATFALMLSPGLAAKGLEYSYADVGYLKYNGDDYDVHAGTVDAFFGVFEILQLRMGYTRGRAENFPKPVDPSGHPDVNEFRFGLRPHYSFGKTFDLYGDVQYFNVKFNGDRTNTDIGWIYAGGFRWQALKWAELDLGGEYRSGDIDAGFGVLQTVFKLTKTFDLSLKTSQGADDSDYFAGIRMKF